MRIIITGGSGLIGRALTSALTAKGYEVIILSRSPETVGGLPRGARAEKWDGKTTAGWGKLADGATAIINLAGAGIADKRWTPERKKLIVDSRVNVTRAVGEAIAAAANPPALIQASAVGYYGSRGDEILTEASRPGDDFVAEVCRQWEAAADPIEAITRVVTLRTGVVLTTKGGALPRLMLPIKLFVGGPLGSGRQWVSWIHIDDEIQAIIWLLENQNARGVFNLVAPDIVTNRELAQKIGQTLNRPAFIPVPGFALKLILGEMAAVVLDGQRVRPANLQDLGYSFLFPKLQPALQDVIAHKK